MSAAFEAGEKNFPVFNSPAFFVGKALAIGVAERVFDLLVFWRILVTSPTV